MQRNINILIVAIDNIDDRVGIYHQRECTDEYFVDTPQSVLLMHPVLFLIYFDRVCCPCSAASVSTNFSSYCQCKVFNNHCNSSSENKINQTKGSVFFHSDASNLTHNWFLSVFMKCLFCYQGKQYVFLTISV